MVETKTPPALFQDNLDAANQQAPQFEVVEWKKDPALRKLYLLCAVGLLIGSATTGYDG